MYPIPPMFRAFTKTQGKQLGLSANYTRQPPFKLLSVMSFHHKANTEPPKGMTVFKNLTKVASESDKFRRVLWTGRNSQLVIMTIPVGGEIGKVWNLRCFLECRTEQTDGKIRKYIQSISISISIREVRKL